MKKLVVIAVLVSLFLVLSSLHSSAIDVFVDNHEIEFTTSPLIVDGKIMISATEIFEEFGEIQSKNKGKTVVRTADKVYIHLLTDVSLDKSYQLTSKKQANAPIKLIVGNTTMDKSGESVLLDFPPQLIDGSTMLSLNTISEVLNCQVGWDSEENRVSIIKSPKYFTMLYAANNRSRSFHTKQLSEARWNGWHEEPVQKLYNANGEYEIFKQTEVEAKLADGWYAEPVQKLYNADGKSQIFKYSEVEAQLAVGWYTEPVQLLYAADGRSQYFENSKVYAQLAVGWYTEPVQLLYAADGRSQYFEKSKVEAQLAVGWYTEPVQKLYAADGRRQFFKKSEVEAQLAVGWYTEPYNNIYKTIITGETKNYISGKEGWSKETQCPDCKGSIFFADKCRICKGSGYMSDNSDCLCILGYYCHSCHNLGFTVKFIRAYTAYEKKIIEQKNRGDIPYITKDGKWKIIGPDGKATDY